MHVIRDTSERLAAGVVRLVRTGRQLGHRVAADLYSDLPSFAWDPLIPLEQEGSQRCSALAVRLGVDVPVASRQVSALGRAGCVERRPDPLDGRAGLISLSDAGAVAPDRVRDVRTSWATGALGGWTEDEARVPGALLERLAEDLERSGRQRSSAPRPAPPGAAAPDLPPRAVDRHHPFPGAIQEISV